MTDQTQTPKSVPAVSAEVIRNEAGQAGALRLAFANGKELYINANDLTRDLLAEALIHGLKQKLVDAAAISRNSETGRSATADDKYQAVKEVYDRLLSGAWNAPREGGGAGSLLFKALCRVKPDQAPSAIRDWLDARTDAEKKALRVNPTIAAIIVEIQAEQAKTDGIDSDALLIQLKMQ